MTTKERIQAAIDVLGEDELSQLYDLIRKFEAERAVASQRGGIMSKLSGIKIKAPRDFAENLDLYVSGEKRVEDNLH